MYEQQNIKIIPCTQSILECSSFYYRVGLGESIDIITFAKLIYYHESNKCHFRECFAHAQKGKKHAAAYCGLVKTFVGVV